MRSRPAGPTCCTGATCAPTWSRAARPPAPMPPRTAPAHLPRPPPPTEEAMKQDFRDRAFLPVMLPLGAVICILVFAFALSRVLLAVPQMVSTFTALLLAGYVLLVAALAATRTRISGRALGVGLFVGLADTAPAGETTIAYTNED